MIGDQNSLVGIYASVAGQMVYDLYVLLHSVDPSQPWSNLEKQRDHDLAKLTQRVASEGMPFLSVVLPRLGKALDRVLAEGTDFGAVEGFKPKSAAEDSVPRFLAPIWECLVRAAKEANASEVDMGKIVSREGTAAYVQLIRAVRTLCYLFYKMESDYTDEQKATKLNSFVEIELSLPEITAPYPETVTGQWVCEEAESVLKEVLDAEFPFRSNISPQSTDQAQ